MIYINKIVCKLEKKKKKKALPYAEMPTNLYTGGRMEI